MLTDVRMSGMDGLALLALVRERAPDVDVVVMTAFEDMKTAIAAMKAGAIEYLIKPLDLDVIDLTVERSFRERAVRRRMKQLSAEAAAPYAISDLVGRDPADDRHLQAHRNGRALADAVLIRGETGTGKEIIARAMGSRRRSQRRVNSAKPAIATATTAMAASQRLRSPPIKEGLLQVHDQQRRLDRSGSLNPSTQGAGSAPTKKRAIYASSACPSVSAESDAALSQ